MENDKKKNSEISLISAVKSTKKIIPFLGSVNSEVKLNAQLDRLEGGKALTLIHH